MTPKTSPLDRNSNPVQLLSALNGGTSNGGRGEGFGQLLENSMQPRPSDGSRPTARGTERPSQSQKPANGDTSARRAEEQSPARPAQDSQAASPAPDTQPQASEDGSETSSERVDAGNAAQETADTGEDAPDPAKLAVLAAVIAALRGDAAPSETEDETPSPTAPANRNTTPLALTDDGEGKHDPNRPDGAKTATTATRPSSSGVVKAAADNTVTGPAGKEVATQTATPRTVDPANTLASSAATGVRNAVTNTAGTEGTTGHSPLAPINSPRSEPTPIQRMLVPTPAGQRMWADDVANRVIWMTGRGESRAELVLTPPSLGKLGVSIQMSGDQTTAHFVAASAAAREALEQALPRLREALQQAGIMLGDASVSTSSDQQTQHGNESGKDGAPGMQSNEYGILPEAVEVATGARWTQGGSNLVDIFA